MLLAAIDFGPDTERVLAYSSVFAQDMGASLTLLHVMDYLITPPVYIDPYMEDEKKSAEEHFDVWKEKLGAKGIKADIEIMVGRLHESFEMAIRKLNADMLILGFKTHAFRKSSSEKLIKGLQIPMLVVRGEKAEYAKIGLVKIKRILCPTDFSDASLKALRTAAKFKNLFNADLHIIHVRVKASDDEEIQPQNLTIQAKDNLDKFLKESGMQNREIIYEGEPSEKIIEATHDYNSDLIIMGARGLSYIKEIFIGSVTDAVLKASHCPVLVIH